MASEQTNTNEAVAHVVAEATRTAIQVMAVAGPERTQNAVHTGQTCDETTPHSTGKQKLSTMNTKFWTRGKQYLQIV